MSKTKYRIANLVIASDYGLPGAIEREKPGDLTIIRLPEKPIPNTAPDKDLMLDAQFPNGFRTTVARLGPKNFLLRYLGRADVLLDLGTQEISISRDPDTLDGFVEVLCAASILAVYIELCGGLTLHASTIAYRDCAFAFAAESGGGKSTLAALLHNRGAGVLGDDLLVPTQNGKRTICQPTSNELRLREMAPLHSAGWHGAEGRISADGRHVLRDNGTAENFTDGLELKAILAPCRGQNAFEISKQLSNVEAITILGNSARRVLGVCDPDWLTRNFKNLIALASSIPVHQISIPLNMQPLELAQNLEAALDGWTN